MRWRAATSSHAPDCAEDRDDRCQTNPRPPRLAASWPEEPIFSRHSQAISPGPRPAFLDSVPKHLMFTTLQAASSRQLKLETACRGSVVYGV